MPTCLALRVHLGLPLVGSAYLATRACRDCRMVVDTLGSRWLSTCPFSRAVFKRRHSAVNRTVSTYLYGAVCISTLEPSVSDPNPHQDYPRLRADQLVHGLVDQHDTFVNVTIACPTAPTFW